MENNKLEQQTIARAMNILANRMRTGPVMKSAKDAADWLKLHYANHDREAATVLFLDHASRLIAAEEMFQGTLGQTSMFPREIARAALRHNAASVVVSHNHPNGIAKPSEADGRATAVLHQALSLVDVELLDHIVVSGPDAYSMAAGERI
jgi:DNA repair protein RadC